MNSEMISGKYKHVTTANLPTTNAQEAQTIRLEHCALIHPLASSQWLLDVRCRYGEEDWQSISKIVPDATVKVSNIQLSVTLPPLKQELEIAAFGKPQEKDIKRKQMAIFGRPPVKGRNWVIYVHLYDDTAMAFENVLNKEEKKGKKLLTPRSGLYVANIDADIRVELNDLEPGWQIKGSNTKVIKIKDAWNSPEDATDFPSCCFEICHVDETMQSFFCKVTASHGNETSEADLIAVFKQESETDKIVERGRVTNDIEALTIEVIDERLVMADEIITTSNERVRPKGSAFRPVDLGSQSALFVLVVIIVVPLCSICLAEGGWLYSDAALLEILLFFGFERIMLAFIHDWLRQSDAFEPSCQRTKGLSPKFLDDFQVLRVLAFAYRYYWRIGRKIMSPGFLLALLVVMGVLVPANWSERQIDAHGKPNNRARNEHREDHLSYVTQERNEGKMPQNVVHGAGSKVDWLVLIMKTSRDKPPGSCYKMKRPCYKGQETAFF